MKNKSFNNSNNDNLFISKEDALSKALYFDEIYQKEFENNYLYNNSDYNDYQNENPYDYYDEEELQNYYEYIEDHFEDD